MQRGRAYAASVGPAWEEHYAGPYRSSFSRRQKADLHDVVIPSVCTRARSTASRRTRSAEATRRYARLADNALLEVLRTPTKRASDKRATSLRETKLSKSAAFGVGPPGFEPGT